MQPTWHRKLQPRNCQLTPASKAVWLGYILMTARRNTHIIRGKRKRRKVRILIKPKKKIEKYLRPKNQQNWLHAMDRGTGLRKPAAAGTGHNMYEHVAEPQRRNRGRSQSNISSKFSMTFCTRSTLASRVSDLSFSCCCNHLFSCASFSSCFFARFLELNKQSKVSCMLHAVSSGLGPAYALAILVRRAFLAAALNEVTKISISKDKSINGD